ncbi:predicted protein [Chaetoceros tenuissimus]|uniref:Uncharacterized protein n=1 Tax=Chaetoceros tenuissimus TaxID=426638 RepID=A0AAD3D5Q9_9STRA|nr:predicted protein [Chaetoceros tenuissimus]
MRQTKNTASDNTTPQMLIRKELGGTGDPPLLVSSHFRRQQRKRKYQQSLQGFSSEIIPECVSKRTQSSTRLSMLRLAEELECIIPPPPLPQLDEVFSQETRQTYQNEKIEVKPRLSRQSSSSFYA